MFGPLFPSVRITYDTKCSLQGPTATVWTLGSVSYLDSRSAIIVSPVLWRKIEWLKDCFAKFGRISVRKDRVCTIQVPARDEAGRLGVIRSYRVGSGKIEIGIHDDGKASLSRGLTCARFSVGSLNGISWALGQINNDEYTLLGDLPEMPFRKGEWDTWPAWYSALIVGIFNEILWLNYEVNQAIIRQSGKGKR